jgi:NAD(P)-dependent dehydrogenase (short-subunit alcohol dehydrogenase family)
MSNRFTNKTVVVTGGASGIGLAAAKAFAAEGAGVAICGRDKAALDAAAKETGAFARVCDVTEPARVAQFVADVMGEFGRIDVLINNAGTLGPVGPLADVSPEDWEATLKANATGPFLATRAVLKAAEPSCVIGISSGQGRKGSAGWGPYAASKHALEGMISVWADEYKGKTRFFSLSPGPTATRMRALAAPKEDPKSIKTPKAVAAALVAIVLDKTLESGTPLRLDPKGKLEC